MSDNLSRYCALRDALLPLYPQKPYGHLACHLPTLTLLISGILGSRKTQLPAVASKAPTVCKRASRLKRLQRFLHNERNSLFINTLPPGPLVLVRETSEVGGACLALRLSVLYKGRALPLGWAVLRGRRGHRCEQEPIALLPRVQALLPAEREGILLGEGEFEGGGLLAFVQAADWQFLCRTAPNARLREGERQAPSFSFADWLVAPGDLIEIEAVFFTKDRFGPLLAVALWNQAHKEPLFLVSRFERGEEALFGYRQRVGRETCFSEKKSRGFSLAHWHLSDPNPLARLLIATCLAYVWSGVCLDPPLGGAPSAKGLDAPGASENRCALSLFQLGLVCMDYCLDYGLLSGLWITVWRKA